MKGDIMSKKDEFDINDIIAAAQGKIESKDEPKAEGETLEDSLITSVIGDLDASEQTKEYLQKLGDDIEIAVSGATNKINLMIAGVIPANYRDLAKTFSTIKVAVAALKNIQDALKKAIINDPTSPDLFHVGSTAYEYKVTKILQLDTATWRKFDPAGYNSTKMLYSKEVERTTFTEKKVSKSK